MKIDMIFEHIMEGFMDRRVDMELKKLIPEILQYIDSYPNDYNEVRSGMMFISELLSDHSYSELLSGASGGGFNEKHPELIMRYINDIRMSISGEYPSDTFIQMVVRLVDELNMLENAYEDTKSQSYSQSDEPEIKESDVVLKTPQASVTFHFDGITIQAITRKEGDTMRYDDIMKNFDVMSLVFHQKNERYIIAFGKSINKIIYADTHGRHTHQDDFGKYLFTFFNGLNDIQRQQLLRGVKTNMSNKVLLNKFIKDMREG